MQVAPSLVTAQWLLTCFVASAMPLSALLRVWDCLFLEALRARSQRERHQSWSRASVGLYCISL